MLSRGLRRPSMCPRALPQTSGRFGVVQFGVFQPPPPIKLIHGPIWLNLIGGGGGGVCKTKSKNGTKFGSKFGHKFRAKFGNEMRPGGRNRASAALCNTAGSTVWEQEAFLSKTTSEEAFNVVSVTVPARFLYNAPH